MLRTGALRSTGALLLIAVALFARPSSAAEPQAGEPETEASPVAWREISVGGTATARSWTLYSNSTFAPLGAISADGVRIRLGSGYGKYAYDRPNHCYDLVNQQEVKPCPSTRHQGRVTFADILAGYQFSYGRLTVKAFGGFAIDTQGLSPWDVGNAAAGKARGAKLALETWTNVTDRLWLQADGAWSGAHDQTSLLTRLGYRLLPNASVGLEEGYHRNVAGHEFRSGMFARYEWTSGELVAAAGVKGERHDFSTNSDKTGAWAALSLLFRY